MKFSRIIAPCLVAAALAASSSPPLASAAADGELLTYRPAQGTVSLLTIGDREAKLPGAPAAFRTFARQAMRQEWQGYLKDRPACKGVPHIAVTGLRTDGFAFGHVSGRPRPGCQYGGGYVAFWAIRKGGWKQVVGTQDVVDCSRLDQLDFPSEVGVAECYDGTDVVPYVHD